MEVARLSDRHGAFVAEALEQLAAAEVHETVRPQDVAVCMELLYELKVATGGGVTHAAARTKLAEASGGKLGAVAKKLLALE